MHKPSLTLVVLAVVMLTVGASLSGQGRQRVSEPQTTSATGRFVITSADKFIILLDSVAGDSWLLKEGSWVPIRRRAPDREETQLGTARLRVDWPRLSPFTRVECLDNDEVHVQFDRNLYELLSIDRIPTTKILESSRKQFGELWEKRFVEDIFEVLAGMGHPPAESVKLELRHRQTGETRTVDRAPLTQENRRKAWEFHNRNRR